MRVHNLSFEFFPPNSANGLEKLHDSAKVLQQLQPEFFSVTYGAGGANQNKTVDAVLQLNQLHPHTNIAPHISCIGASKANLLELLNLYKKHDIKHLVVLRGDLPPEQQDLSSELEHAGDLVAFIREQFADYFYIEVAAYPEFHPEAINPKTDILYFKQKVEAGANSAITQYFFNPDAYFAFIDSCQQNSIAIPIIPGIMPIYDCMQLERFSDTCGAELPRWIRKKLEAMQGDKADLVAFGIDVVTGLCHKLLEQGAPGLHFYTLNKTGVTSKICNNLLGLS